MGLTTFMFPGQGSQYVGMRQKGAVLAAAGRELLRQADEMLGTALVPLVDDGPEEELTRTCHAQPALLAMGIAWARVLEGDGLRADIVMGHSVGEYAALVWAGVLGVDDALRLVHRRGLLMERAVRDTPGKMAAVVRVAADKLDEVVAACRDHGLLEVTNFNAPGQVVLSGENAAVDAAVARINDERLGRALPLNVAAPFHSSLMAGVAAVFGDELDRVPFRRPRRTFIDNVTGEREDDPERIRAKLVDQLRRPVLWEKSVRTAIALGSDTFVESGPKAVLAGLAKRIDRTCKVVIAERRAE